MPPAEMLPLAHLGHYLWVFYLVPVAVVVAGILRSTLMAKRADREATDPPSSSKPPGSAENAPDPPGTGREAENGGSAPARRPPSP